MGVKKKRTFGNQRYDAIIIACKTWRTLIQLKTWKLVNKILQPHSDSQGWFKATLISQAPKPLAIPPNKIACVCVNLVVVVKFPCAAQDNQMMRLPAARFRKILARYFKFFLYSSRSLIENHRCFGATFFLLKRETHSFGDLSIARW